MCGVVGLRVTGAKPWAAELAVSLLSRLQHRGQDGAGLTVLGHDGRLESVRGLGLIENALANWTELPPAVAAMAHTRYATTGRGGVGEIQPFVQGVPRLALAHNGNIVNCAELIARHDLKVESASDLDVLIQFFLKKQREGGLDRGFLDAVQGIFDEFIGSYAVVGLEENGELFAFRDPFGIRPLFLARSQDGIAFASETCALAPLADLSPGMKTEELKPGEWVRVKANGEIERGVLRARINPEHKKRFCMFESVYFSSPLSETNGESVYRQRFSLGVELGREIRWDLASRKLNPTEAFDYVTPVPETSRVATIAVAETLQLPYREFLIKNPYVPRTFILKGQEQRLKALQHKLSLIGPEIKGRRVLLVDDSVVRGNTSRMMALRLREAGAKEVVLASTCPPIRFGCYYGIDFPDPEELVATGRDVQGIAKSLGVDALHYLSIDGLKKALKTPDLCMACLDGDYPAAGPAFEKFLAQRREQRQELLRT